MKKNYEWTWLDNVITIDLNPERKETQPVTNEKATEIMKRIEQEESDMLSRLKSRIFKLHDEHDSITLVKKYHDALVLMITKNYDYLHHPATKTNPIKQLHEFIGKRLKRMLAIFEKEFSRFMDDENRMPITQLISIKEEILKREKEMKANLSTGDHGLAPVDIVMEVFNDFIEKIDNREAISIREANYITDLVKDVINIDGNFASVTGCPALNELLIYWNLNSKACIRYFTVGAEALLNSFETPEEKLEFLRFESKKLQIIPEKQNSVLNPDFPSVKDYCWKWLKNEIEYREMKLEGFIPLAQVHAERTMKETAFKVMIAASVDQVGLLLRAADDLGILKARSKSAIFKAIFPHISTPGSENPNWNRSRTSSYVPEQSDIEVCKRMLHNWANKIDEYK